MNSIILLANESTDAAILEALSSINKQAGTEAIIVAARQPAGFPASAKFISSALSNISDAISRAIKAASGGTLLLIDGRCSWQSASLQQILAEGNKGSGLTWFPVTSGAESITLSKGSAQGILHTITNSANIPAVCVAVKASLVAHLELPQSGCTTETISHLITQLLTSGAPVQRAAITLEAPAQTCNLSDAARARILKALIASANVEDLFPNHDWKNNDKESAAASYHTLAALFIRLGDDASAEECLQLSDGLEDSPRSLALKGILARERGEILGAVANMVSSLQQYEIRKKENADHYSRFNPHNIEVINESLNAGLQALNKRENEVALNCFTEAVFNFDPFYSQLGMDRAREI